MLTPTLATAGDLTDEERRIAAYVDAHAEEAVALLERVVNVPSATQNLAGVRRVGREFEAEFTRLGFQSSWVDLPQGLNRAGHLLAERDGSKGKRLLLIGHLDTVLEGEPFRREGAKAFGSGTSDMKAGDVVVVQALKALHSVGALADRRIIVVFTGDEEDAGLPTLISRGHLVEAARRSDVALGFESAIDDTATVARRGASTWKLVVTARSGHSAGILGERAGAGAIFEAARILDAFRCKLPEEYLTFNPSVIVGGTTAEYDGNAKRGSAEGKTNVIPALVEVEGDLRFISEEQKQKAREMMRAIAAENLKQTHATISFADEYPAMPPTERNAAVLEALSRASVDLGLGPVKALDPGRRGAGDISFVAQFVACLDGLGAGGEGAHKAGEFADLDSLPAQTKRAALLLYRLTR